MRTSESLWRISNTFYKDYSTSTGKIPATILMIAMPF